MTIAKNTQRLNRAAKRLNQHHEKYCAGFYPSTGCARAFGARVRKGQLQITADFESWIAIDIETTQFRDHNGRTVFL